jgi:uncharacterized membrane protein YebE (DUF533 family)
MFDAQNLVAALMQSGMSNSTGPRVQHALGDQGLGGAGLGGGLGGIAQMAESMLGGAGRSLGGMDQAIRGTLGENRNAALGGIGALAGALLGGGGGAMRGALGGGALALLGSLAISALQKAQAAKVEEPPLGLREPATPEESQALQDKSLVILKAMISAAKADGQIDAAEMQRILGKLGEAGADAEAKSWVVEEMGRPLDLEGLLCQVTDAQTGAEVYAASLLAIDADTPAEKDYLARLAQGLGLDAAVVDQLHQTLGVKTT